jgi:hypothetical protein
MYKHQTISIAVLGAALVASLLATPALADPAPGETAPAATSADATAPPADPALTSPSIDVAPTPEQRMADCMATWDKGTHMTKQQWRHTCKNSLEEFPNP